MQVITGRDASLGGTNLTIILDKNNNLQTLDASGTRLETKLNDSATI